jgi:hypothetical protein
MPWQSPAAGGDFDAMLARNGVEVFEINHQRRAITLLKSGWALRRLARNWGARRHPLPYGNQHSPGLAGLQACQHPAGRDRSQTSLRRVRR